MAQIEWLGGPKINCSQIPDPTQAQLCRTAEQRDFGTSEADIDFYVQQAAAGGGAAACTAMGCPQCAPFCSYVASEVAKVVWDGIKDTFGNITKNLGGAGARKYYDRVAAAQADIFNIVSELQTALNMALGNTATALVQTHDDLFPTKVGAWTFGDAIAQMGLFGLPLVGGYPYIPSMGIGLSSTERPALTGLLAPDYYGALYVHADFLSGKALAKKHPADAVGRAKIIEGMLPQLIVFAEQQVDNAAEWSQKLMLAGGLTAGLLAQNATEEKAAATSLEVALKFKPKKKKKSVVVPVVVAGAGLGVLAWLLL